MDRDGLLDLLIGDKNGNFTFFKNIGTSTAPNFVGNFQLAPNKYKFGKFSTKGAGDTEGDATPGILTINGKDLLVSGSQKGKIFLLSEMNGDTSIALQELIHGQMKYIQEGKMFRYLQILTMMDLLTS